MTSIGALPGGGPATGRTEDARLKTAVRQLQGVFVQQLFKSMRETVPHDGMVDGGSGEEMFTGMLDEKVADEAPSAWMHGTGEALLRQLQHARERQHGGAAPAPAEAT